MRDAMKVDLDFLAITIGRLHGEIAVMRGEMKAKDETIAELSARLQVAEGNSGPPAQHEPGTPRQAGGTA